MMAHSHTTILSVEQSRKNFTRHGLHLNCWGKDLLGDKTASAVDLLLRPKKVVPIALAWKLGSNELRMESNDVTIVPSNNRISARANVPKNKNKDFLREL
jgi:hypothetical protein